MEKSDHIPDEEVVLLLVNDERASRRKRGVLSVCPQTSDASITGSVIAISDG
jgi:hypothetical protein